ncbi:Transcriptional regulator, LysR family protein [Enhygromyxa salina]|uniref:Transcriptional regulator, LysR family protein n=2 Tax=Enhygromyxa salina TaxID=215803 RepID=A0A0C2CVS3_9BACT|nr:Transcriptional regulator, LysR family protein [Enhygromyxa salina]
MDLDEVRAFVAVVDSGSFKAASAGIKQPRATLRRRVEALEARVGVPLLERNHAGVSLTNAGSVLVRHGRQMLSDAGALLGMLRGLPVAPSKVRLGLPLGTPPEGLHELCCFFERVAPQVQLELRFSEDPARDLLRSVDVALSFYPPPANSELVSQPLIAMREGLRASKGYLRRHGTPRSIAELSSHRLLAWCTPNSDVPAWPRHSGGQFEITPAVTSSDYQLLRRLAARGSGITLLPDVNLPDLDPEDAELVPVLADLVGREHYLHVVTTQVLLDSLGFDDMFVKLQRFMSIMLPGNALRDWAKDCGRTLGARALSVVTRAPAPQHAPL